MWWRQFTVQVHTVKPLCKLRNGTMCVSCDRERSKLLVVDLGSLEFKSEKQNREPLMLSPGQVLSLKLISCVLLNGMLR